MDSRSFNSRLASRLNVTARQAATLSDALVTVIRTALSDLDNVAMPGFGTFTANKTPEHLQTDEVSGRSMLMPPHISSNFVPGSHLKKSLKK